MNNENTSFSHEIACPSFFYSRVIYYVTPQLQIAHSQLITSWFKLRNSVVDDPYSKDGVKVYCKPSRESVPIIAVRRAFAALAGSPTLSFGQATSPATPQSSNKLHSDRTRASSWHNFDMDQIDAQNLSERLQWEQQDYWLHIESSSPLDKYPGS